MIVKVQRPLMAAKEFAQILIYNESRSVSQLFNTTPELDKLPLKSFWYAHIEKGQLVLDKEAPWQDW